MADTFSWSYSLRSGGLFLDEDVEDDGKATTTNPRPSDTLDLSKRDDAAQFKPNPWSLAKLNAATRKKNASEKPTKPPIVTPAPPRSKPRIAPQSIHSTRQAKGLTCFSPPPLKTLTHTPAPPSHAKIVSRPLLSSAVQAFEPLIDGSDDTLNGSTDCDARDIDITGTEASPPDVLDPATVPASQVEPRFPTPDSDSTASNAWSPGSPTWRLPTPSSTPFPYGDLQSQNPVGVLKGLPPHLALAFAPGRTSSTPPDSSSSLYQNIEQSRWEPSRRTLPSTMTGATPPVQLWKSRDDMTTQPPRRTLTRRTMGDLDHAPVALQQTDRHEILQMVKEEEMPPFNETNFGVTAAPASMGGNPREAVCRPEKHNFGDGEDATWSTLPSKKRKLPSSKGPVKTARFRLPTVYPDPRPLLTRTIDYQPPKKAVLSSKPSDSVGRWKVSRVVGSQVRFR